ncbi:bifunctional D-glycero-beta-D-manno-heptose-7-phosphate kinase/D-glycero-beta-D-manno-heptose 1-phosphate adenylyltransferase HldE [Ignatzschineria cameli]|nr:bifunctional D-glycero-beta-D-manno-heptose-7-phosphate kinase/D-glycero-beta-D-manno-heptose 1-phosphate adenylyltransferase HldE [Ignatzschineria cameli]
MKDSIGKIAVFGDIMIDSYWIGSTNRISPESPVPVVNINHTENRLGGAANVALNISKMECPVTLAGLVGIDSNAQELQQLCEQNQIATEFVAEPSFPTIKKLRIISRQQHIVRCDFEEAPELTTTLIEKITQSLKATIDENDLIVLSDYNKGFLSDPQALIQHARAQGKFVIIDPKGDDFSKYRGASLLTPNTSEFEIVAGKCRDEAELFAKAEKLRIELDLDALLITRSEKGMTLFERDKDPVTFSAKAQDVFDVTGAGDTVIAMIATQIAKGTPLPQACKIANIAASIVVGKMGASYVTQEELDYELGHSDRPHNLVLSKEALLHEVKRAKMNNETIVMTNGCFDLLHRGHVKYLEEASKLGHHLIVALNSDASVKRLKGELRPIMDEKSRATVLASLSSVAWVTLFDEDTPESLIREILPDVLVKGSDYTIEEIAGADAVINNGGRVELIDFVDGYSTSRAIEKIIATQQ